MALATGESRHNDWKTPAASAVPLTEESLSPRHQADTLGIGICTTCFLISDGT